MARAIIDHTHSEAVPSSDVESKYVILGLVLLLIHFAAADKYILVHPIIEIAGK